MRRFLFAVGLLLTAAASESDAGYVIVRIILEGSGGAGAADTGGGGSTGPGGEMMPRPPAYPQPGPMSSGGPGPGGPGGVSGGTKQYQEPGRSVFAVVPFTKKWEHRPFYKKFGPHPNTNPSWDLVLTHEYGVTNLFTDGSHLQLYEEFAKDPSYTRTRQKDVAERHVQWAKNPTDATALFEILTDALETGLVAEAVACADELTALVAGKKATRVTPPVEQFVRAYQQIQKPLKEPAKAASESQIWKDRLGFIDRNVSDQTRDHYSLVYWDAPDAERTRRLGQLNDNLRAFFLWHATHGVALTVPDRPLLAVLPRTGAETNAIATALDGAPRVADASYAPDYDVLVLSTDRLDDVGQTFQKQLQQMYREGLNRQILLEASDKGGGPKLFPTPGVVKDSRTPNDVARMMTWAMVDRFTQDEAEWAAVSREGSRQLLYATGRLPRHVAIPQWLENGSVEFFSRPKGPVYTTRPDSGKDVVTLALATGYGGPNFVRQKQFKDLVDRKQLGADAGALLRHVVTDAYYAAARDQIDADDPKLPPPPKKKPAAVAAGTSGPGPMGVMPGPMAAMPGPGGMGTGFVGPGGALPAEDVAFLARRKREFLTSKAHATSWALYFHLAKNHPAGLDRYLAELGKLPRDFPIEESVRLALFAKAFDLTTAATAEAGRQTFAEFGTAWLRAMGGYPPVSVDLELADPDPAKGATTTGGMGPGPMFR